MNYLVQDEVFCEQVCVAEALKDSVDEAGIAVVANSNHSGNFSPTFRRESPLPFGNLKSNTMNLLLFNAFQSSIIYAFKIELNKFENPYDNITVSELY